MRVAAFLAAERREAPGHPDGGGSGERRGGPLPGRGVQRHRAGSRAGPVGGQDLDRPGCRREPARIVALGAAAVAQGRPAARLPCGQGWLVSGARRGHGQRRFGGPQPGIGNSQPLSGMADRHQAAAQVETGARQPGFPGRRVGRGGLPVHGDDLAQQPDRVARVAGRVRRQGDTHEHVNPVHLVAPWVCGCELCVVAGRLGEERDGLQDPLVPRVADKGGGEIRPVPRGITGRRVQLAADLQCRGGVPRRLLVVSEQRGVHRLGDVELIAPL